MSSNARYAPIPNPHTDPHAQDEMEAAFLESEDEDEHDQPQTRSHNTRNGYSSLPAADPETPPSPSREDASGAGQTYDFERVDYDGEWARPPPGSPPASMQFFQVQANGNSNGIVPDLTRVARDAGRRTGGWARSILPTRVAERLGMGGAAAEGAVGGGMGNDGVFANVTAKPSRPVRITEGEHTLAIRNLE